MATIRNEPNGRKSILVVCVDRKRRTVRMGKLDEEKAIDASERIQELADRRKDGESISKNTLKWLGEQPNAIRARIERAGLVDPKPGTEPTKKVETIKTWTDSYLAKKKIAKRTSREAIEKAQSNLIDYFGADRPIASITSYDAETWRDWLKAEGNRRDTGSKDKEQRKGLADNTVRRRTGYAKQFFRAAMRNKLIAENPFVEAELPSSVTGNEKRHFHVPAEWAYSIIDQAPNADWRTIIALARFGGLRCPSEVLRLKLTDVNVEKNVMTIHASKTEHHEGGGIRQCPIFPELEPFLVDAFAAAPDGAEFVVNRYRNTAANLRTHMLRLIARAGLEPWPKLFQNLRASCENDLIDAGHHPKAVAKWLGHSVTIAAEHYYGVTDDAFTKAVAIGSGKKRHTLPAQQPNADHCTPLQNGEETFHEPEKRRNSLVTAGLGMGDEGLEPPTSSV